MEMNIIEEGKQKCYCLNEVSTTTSSSLSSRRSSSISMTSSPLSSSTTSSSLLSSAFSTTIPSNYKSYLLYLCNEFINALYITWSKSLSHSVGFILDF